MRESRIAVFIVLSLASFVRAMTLPIQRNLENIFRSINEFHLPSFNDFIIIVLYLVGCVALYFLIKKLLEKKEINFLRLQKIYLIIIFAIYLVLNFNSLIRKNDFWIEKRKQVLSMNLKGKNSITFIGEKSYVVELNLQILKYLTELDGKILPANQEINSRMDKITIEH